MPTFNTTCINGLSVKPIFFLSFVLLLLFTLVFPKPGAAEGQGPSVVGNFQISTGVGPTRHIEFHASKDKNGNTIGETIFRDRSTSDTKSGGEDQSPMDSSSLFWLKAQFDCLVIDGNRAVMGGSVTESNSRLIGHRLLLVVQDGDASTPRERDKLTFGIYRPAGKDWVAIDSERPDDDAPPVQWIAQDSEREDDEPVSSQKSDVTRCDSFPISVFSFISANLGRGSIEVKP